MLRPHVTPVAVSTNYDELDADWQTEIRVQSTYLKAAGIDLSDIEFEWSAFDYEYDVFENIQKLPADQDPKEAAITKDHPDFQIMQEHELPRPRKPE